MSLYISSLINKTSSLFRLPILSITGNVLSTREASKKTSGSTSGGGRPKPKHRRVRVPNGGNVQKGTLLVTQKELRFHPGLNVGMGRNGTLYAMHPGTVMVTCEIVKPNWEHPWVRRHYSGREDQTIYKKYFHVIRKPMSNRFKLIDTV